MSGAIDAYTISQQTRSQILDDFAYQLTQIQQKANQLSHRILKNEQEFCRIQGKWEKEISSCFPQRWNVGKKMLDQLLDLEVERDIQKEEKKELIEELTALIKKQKKEKDTRVHEVQETLKLDDGLDEIVEKTSSSPFLLGDNPALTRIENLRQEIKGQTFTCSCPIL